MDAGLVGIIANPASGKDIRRVVARASVFDNPEKQAICRRAIAGALAAGARSFAYMPDGYDIVRSAVQEHGIQDLCVELESPQTGSALDTVRCARQLAERGCRALITLGGDGTNRAVTLGWREAPLVPISTGTNNVFPRMVEATVAGAAAGLLASGAVTLAECARRAKVVTCRIDGENDDLALIDAVLIGEQFVGARAIWDITKLRAAVLTRADPAAVGISSIGGLILPVTDIDDAGLSLTFGGEATVLAPVMPGAYERVGVRSARRLALGEAVTLQGPGVLAFDGERERVLKPGQRATLTVHRDGPSVVDVAKALALAACHGHFRSVGVESTGVSE